MADPVGIAVAYGEDALAETPTWTRLDTTAGVSVRSWSTRRGRAYLSDRTDAGSATIGFSDQVGALDPTNSAGAFYPMDPNCPAAIALQHAVTGAWTTVFRGQIQDAPVVLLDGARRHTGSLPLVDMFSLLALKEIPPGFDFDASDAGTGAANSSGNTRFVEQTVQDRINAILSDVGVPLGLRNIFSGNVDVQETVYSPGTKALAALQDAADAEFPGVANLFMSKDGLVTFKGRLARFDPTSYPPHSTWHVGDAAAAAANSGWAVLAGVKIGRDVAKVINNALFTPKGIQDVDIAGQLVVDPDDSIAKYGPRALTGQDLIISFDNLTSSNANDACKAFGQFYVDNFAQAQTRIQQAMFRWVHPSHPNAAGHWAMLCGVEIGDVVIITTTHLASGGFAGESYFVEGISYDAQLGMRGIWDITMTLDLSPKTLYSTDEWS